MPRASVTLKFLIRPGIIYGGLPGELLGDYLVVGVWKSVIFSIIRGEIIPV
jgi:hypothetical protein